MASRRGALSGVVAQTRHSMGVRLPDRTEFPLIAGTSDNFFDALGVKAALGHVYHAGGGRDGEVVVSHRYWQRTLGGDPGILSRELRVDNADLRVVGVLPAGFGGVNRGLAVDIFVPVQTGYGALRFGALTDKRNNDFEVVGRLRAGARCGRGATRGRGGAAGAWTRKASRRARAHGAASTAWMDRMNRGPRRRRRCSARSWCSSFSSRRPTSSTCGSRRTRSDVAKRRSAWRSAPAGSSCGGEHLTEMLILGVAAGALSALVAAWLIDLAPSMLFPGERFVDFFIRFDVRTWAFTLGAILLVALVGTALPFRDASRTTVSVNLVARVRRAVRAGCRRSSSCRSPSQRGSSAWPASSGRACNT